MYPRSIKHAYDEMYKVIHIEYSVFFNRSLGTYSLIIVP